MSTKLFVGGLAYAVNDDQLRDLFAPFGTIESAVVIVDKYSNQSKGFGFVEFSTAEEAQAAIKELDGKDFEGRTIAVNEARPREERRPGGSRDFGGGGGGHRSGGGNDRRGGGGRSY